MKTFNITLLLLSFTIQCFAFKPTLIKATLIKNDGNEMKGYVTFFYSADKKINYYQDSESKKLSVKSDDIKEITLYPSNENNEKSDTLIFHKFKIGIYGFAKKFKIEKEPVWATQTYSSEKINGYEIYFDDGYHSQGFGGMSYKSNSAIGFCSKLPEDDYIHYHSEISQLADPFHAYDKLLRKSFTLMIKEKCPKMEKLISEKKYQIEDFIQLLKDYTDTCE